MAERKKAKRRPGIEHRDEAVLISNEPTIELILRARVGDQEALEAILQRCLPLLKRWAHGRLPAAARGHLDTGDLVQEAALNAISKLDTFEPRHVGALQAYLRRSVMNRICDEVRRVERRPAAVELHDEDIASNEPSQLERTIQEETYERYTAALAQLRPRDRELVVIRMEAQWTWQQIADRFGFPSPDAARIAVRRALQRLKGSATGPVTATP